MYSKTRQDASELLGISTRSIDRYIRGGKLRAKKDGKIVYINDQDLDNLINGGSSKQEVIIPKEKKEEKQSVSVSKEIMPGSNIESIYNDLRQQIKEKDDIILNLSERVGRAEEIAKNSVSLMDFKKSQFLLEESKGHLNNEVVELKRTKDKLSKDLKYEKNTNIILIFFLILLLILSVILWFIKI